MSKLEEILEQLWMAHIREDSYVGKAEKHKAIALKAISDLVIGAVGEDEYHQDTSFGGTLPKFETKKQKIRNELRADIKANLKQRGIGDVK